MNLYNSAKAVFDFYMDKLYNDIENEGTHFAREYANLKLLRYQTSGMLNALESYEIEVEK